MESKQSLMYKRAMLSDRLKKLYEEIHLTKKELYSVNKIIKQGG